MVVVFKPKTTDLASFSDKSLNFKSKSWLSPFVKRNPGSLYCLQFVNMPNYTANVARKKS